MVLCINKKRRGEIDGDGVGGDTVLDRVAKKDLFEDTHLNGNLKNEVNKPRPRGKLLC